MTLSEFRYTLEHELLTRYYFEDAAALFGGDDDEDDADNYLFDIVADIANKCGFDLPYTKEQYDVELYQISDDDFMCKITLPEPEESLLCSHIYLLLSDDYSNRRFFTVELLEIRRKRKYYCLCEWSDLGHHNHGEVPNNIEQIEKQIVELYYNGLEESHPPISTVFGERV